MVVADFIVPQELLVVVAVDQDLLLQHVQLEQLIKVWQVDTEMETQDHLMQVVVAVEFLFLVDLHLVQAPVELVEMD